MNRIFLFIVGCMALYSCAESIRNAEEMGVYPSIFPDYQGVSIPVNIAPLNFMLTEPCEKLYVFIRGKKNTIEIHASAKIAIPIKKWRKLLGENAGDSLSVTVCVRQNNIWKKYLPFSLYVIDTPIDPYLVYRLIAPGYEAWSEMGIYQRSLCDFDEKPVITTRLLPGICMNCHSFCQNNPAHMLFHLRGSNGGTILMQHGMMEKLNTKTDSTISNGVYPYWHPSGRYVAFSVNSISQVFHARKDKRIEVIDSESDIVIYDIVHNQLLTSALIASKTALETFPAFTPDGKTLIFSSAEAKIMPYEYDRAKYSLCSISFDAEKEQFGNHTDTLVNSSVTGRSVSFPRVSPNGKFVMFTQSDYGNFPIWHKSADLYLMDLTTRQYKPLTKVNSDDTESYHSWSSDSHWFVFSSRRLDGLYTRPFIAYMDDHGNTGKPFLLPQNNPEMYHSSMKSFNIPEFIVKTIELDCYQVEDKVKQKNIKQVKFKKET